MRKLIIRLGQAIKSLKYEHILLAQLGVLAVINFSGAMDFSAPDFLHIMYLTVIYAVPLLAISGIVKVAFNYFGDFLIYIGEYERPIRNASLWIDVKKTDKSHEILLFVKNNELHLEAKDMHVLWVDVKSMSNLSDQELANVYDWLRHRLDYGSPHGREIKPNPYSQGEIKSINIPHTIKAWWTLFSTPGYNDFIVETLDNDMSSKRIFSIGEYVFSFLIIGEMENRNISEYVDVLVNFDGKHSIDAKIVYDS